MALPKNFELSDDWDDVQYVEHDEEEMEGGWAQGKVASGFNRSLQAEVQVRPVLRVLASLSVLLF
jgi:hypothetical protein